jgi:hypothetical protein
MVVLMVSIFCAPWVVAIAWIVHRHGLHLLFPRDDLPVSYGEHSQRRTAVR